MLEVTIAATFDESLREVGRGAIVIDRFNLNGNVAADGSDGGKSQSKAPPNTNKIVKAFRVISIL